MVFGPRSELVTVGSVNSKQHVKLQCFNHANWLYIYMYVFIYIQIIQQDFIHLTSHKCNQSSGSSLMVVGNVAPLYRGSSIRTNTDLTAFFLKQSGSLISFEANSVFF